MWMKYFKSDFQSLPSKDSTFTYSAHFTNAQPVTNPLKMLGGDVGVSLPNFLPKMSVKTGIVISSCP